MTSLVQHESHLTEIISSTKSSERERDVRRRGEGREREMLEGEERGGRAAQ
jgi:hypothetical protein